MRHKARLAAQQIAAGAVKLRPIAVGGKCFSFGRCHHGDGSTRGACFRGRRVEKTRHLLPWGVHTIELDVYTGALEGLLVAEIEFASEQEAVALDPPAWFGRDITSDERYKNRQLARLGLPDT